VVGWLDKHRALFESEKMPWPPKLDPQFMSIADHFGGRCAESAYFCNYNFPPTEEGYTFFDSQMQLPWLVDADAAKLRNPWRSTVPTIAASSKMIVRCCTSSSIDVRMFHPVEAMRVAGWDLDHWADGPAFWNRDMDWELLNSLAGNAFSAFAFTPVLSASLAALGSTNVVLEPISAALNVSRPLE
jgi:hypothetical protein